MRAPHTDAERLRRLEVELKLLEGRAVKTILAAQEAVKLLESKVDKLQREVEAVRQLIAEHSQKRT